MNEFAKRLREVRKARSLTQEELAEKADISRVMVSRYETDMVIPTVEVLISLADALEVSIDYLLGRIDQNNQFFASCSSSSPEFSSDHNTFPEDKAALRQFILEVLAEYHLIT